MNVKSYIIFKVRVHPITNRLDPPSYMHQYFHCSPVMPQITLNKHGRHIIGTKHQMNYEFGSVSL